MCDGISNFEPGMTLGQNSWVFIVIGTVTPSIRKGQGCPKNRLQKYISNKSYFLEILKMSVFKGCIVYIVLRGACRCSIFNFGV